MSVCNASFWHAFIRQAHAAQEEYQQNGDADALNRAVRTWSQMLDHPDFDSAPSDIRFTAWYDKGVAHLHRYWEMNELADLDQAVFCLHSLSTQQPADGDVLGTLALVWRERFLHSDSSEDLSAALQVCEQALAFLPNRPDLLSNFAYLLRRHYQQTNQATDLDRAINAYQQALVPEDDSLLSSLSETLESRYQHSGGTEDLERAIELNSLALAQASGDEEERAALLDGLGRKLRTRYAGSGENGDLHQAIGMFTQALALTPENSDAFAKRTQNLGTALFNRYSATGELEDLTQARQLFEQAVDLNAEMPDALALSNWGLALLETYQHSGQSADLEQAVNAHRQAVGLAAEDSSDYAFHAVNLAIALQTRAESTDMPENLQEAIEWYRRSLALISPNSPQRAAYLSNYGNALQQHYARSGSMQSLEQAIAAYREAVDLSGPQAPERASWLNNLGNGYSERYDHSGDMADLIRAIDVYRQAIQAGPDNVLEQSCYLNNLAAALRERYLQTADVTDLEQAVTASRRAVAVVPSSSTDRPAYLSNLGNGLSELYNRNGEEIYQQQAIAAYRHAVAQFPRQAPQAAGYWNNLGTSLRDNFQRSGQVRELDEAIAAFEQALTVTPDTAPDYAAYLGNLGVALVFLYQRDSRLATLDRAIATLTQALDLMPEQAPVRALQLDHLASSLRERFARQQDPDDLEQAIAFHRQALALAPQGSAALHCNNLGIALYQRYRHAGHMPDLEQALAAYQEAVSLTPPDSTAYASRLNNLGTGLNARYQHSGHPEDLTRASQNYRRAALSARKNQAGDAIGCAANWLGLEFSARHWQAVTQACGHARQAAEHLLHGQDTRAHKESWLKEMQGITVKAAYAFAKLDKLKKAAEALEQGQARLLSESLALSRADLSALQETANAHLYDAYQDTVQRWHWARQHKPEALKEIRDLLDGLIEQIRRLPGYAEFLMPSGWTDIQAAAANAPLLYVSATEHGGLALLVQAEVRSIWLPDFSETVLHDILQSYLNAYSAWLNAEDEARCAAFAAWCETLDNTARRLWDCVFAPLRDSLPEEAVLIPAGLLNLLPLHAAWTPDNTAPSGRRYALDCWRIRYAPNARALKNTPLQEMAAGKLLAIDNPDNSANPRITLLANSAHEIRAVCAGFPDAEILSGPAATRAAVLDALPRSQILHFSCHGHSDLEQPLRSSLLMANGEQLSLLDFLNTRLHARLAVLSACETGLPGARLPDEGISLAAGLLQAGVAGVVSSLWSVSDISTFLLMNRFYQYLAETSPAESLRRAQQWLRDSSNREILAEVREQVEAGSLDEAAYKQVRRAFGFNSPDQRNFAHPFYWAAFGVVGV
ncbi:MAG: CHAT domain-containing protein [Gammaproteobacteria bacterium]|nr:CHAT domain-containing protein [Gammaproteobacteria bacterium]